MRDSKALNQHLLMEEEVLVRALEQYSGDARKPIAAMVLEHQQMRRAAAGATAAIRRCNAWSFLANAKALRLIMAEHCRKEEGIVLAMADHYLRRAACFLIDSMRAMEIPIGMTIRVPFLHALRE